MVAPVSFIYGGITATFARGAQQSDPGSDRSTSHIFVGACDTNDRKDVKSENFFQGFLECSFVNEPHRRATVRRKGLFESVCRKYVYKCIKGQRVEVRIIRAATSEGYNLPIAS